VPLASLPPRAPKIDLAQNIVLHIESLNLSEDLSKTLSTNNDELLVLIYNKTNAPLNKPLYQKKLTLDKDNMERNLFIPRTDIPEGQDLLFLLIEQDYDTPIEQLDPIIRVQYEYIIEAFKKRDYQKIRTYLGTEDLLGYKTIEHYTYDLEVNFDIRGVYKADFYEYKISMRTYQ
jgi:hypothetical protein